MTETNNHDFKHPAALREYWANEKRKQRSKKKSKATAAAISAILALLLVMPLANFAAADLANFGYMGEGSLNHIDSYNLILTRHQAPANGTIVNATLRWTVSSGNPAAYPVVYSDESGAVGQLLDVGDAVYPNAAPVTAGGLAVPVFCGTYYWIGAFTVFGGDSGRFYYDNKTGDVNRSAFKTIGGGSPPQNTTGLTYVERLYCVTAGLTFDPVVLTHQDLVAEGYTAVSSVLSESTIGWQDKSFYANGRFWLFYMDGINGGGNGTARFVTSTDGETWTEPTVAATNLLENLGENLAPLYYNGFIDLFAREGTALTYRRGIPEANGTITWISDWQSFWTVSTPNCDFYPARDSSGYLWVSWGYGSNFLNFRTYVLKDDWNNGTWHNATGFPKQVSTRTSQSNNFIVPLPSGKMYVMYFTATDATPTSPIYGALWNGTAFETEQQATVSCPKQQFSTFAESWSRSAIVDMNGNIYIAFLSTENKLLSIKRDYITGIWETEKTIHPYAPSYASPAIYITGEGTLQAYWIYNSTTIVFKEQDAGLWAENPIAIINEPDQIPIHTQGSYGFDKRLNAFIEAYGNALTIVWVANTTTPNTYKIRFYPLTPPAEYSPTVPTEPEEPEIEDIPIPIGDNRTINLYFHANTLTVNNITGYSALTTVPTQVKSFSVAAAGSVNVSWGWRIYHYTSARSHEEITDGVPVGVVTQTAAGGNVSALLSGTYTLSKHNLEMGISILEFALYSRLGSGAWSVQAVFVTNYLFYKSLEASTITFNIYSTRNESGGYTFGTAKWGTTDYLGGVTGLVFVDGTSADWQSYYLLQGNLLSFLTIPYTHMIGNAFYALILFGVFMSLYIRYKSIAIPVLLIVLLGGSGGVINLFVGDAFIGFVWIVVAFGLGLVYWKVFR